MPTGVSHDLLLQVICHRQPLQSLLLHIPVLFFATLAQIDKEDDDAQAENGEGCKEVKRCGWIVASWLRR